MNDFNSSDGSNGVVSSALQTNSNDTAQFNLQGLRKFNISLRANRVNGEYFPAIEGDFLYIARCDIPCSISLIRMDGGHETLSCEGDEYHGSFKGIWITHVNLSAVPGATPLNLTILTGTGETFSNNLSSKAGSRYPQGIITSATMGLGGNVTADAWIPDNARQIDDICFYSTITLTAAPISEFTGTICFQGPSFNNLVSPIVTTNGVAYSSAVIVGITSKCDVIIQNTATFVYRVGFRYQGIKIPSMARNVTMRVYVGPLNNMASAANNYNAFNGDVAACYIS
jgi:hypothetical protein